MKHSFLKNVLPIAVAALGISGAFMTTSMQSASKREAPPKMGFLANSQGKCTDISVNCESIPNPFFCRLGVTSGPIAYEKDALNNCVQPLYRP
jgi:hypothetical protein